MVKILFVCKHNVFRSKVAEAFFNRINKNKKNKANSAGLFKWKEEDIISDKGYLIEKKVAKKFGIKLNTESKVINSSMLKNTDILVIVADDVPRQLFENEKAFNGKVIVWKVKDVKEKQKNKEKIALKSIDYIEEKVKNLVKSLK